MSRSRVFINGPPRPIEPAERRLWERFSQMVGERPLDGTNLAWIYDRCPNCTGEMRRGQLGRECSECGLRANASH